MELIIKPRLTMAYHRSTPAPSFDQTLASIPVPVTIPTMSVRARIIMRTVIALFWFIVAVYITTICLLPIPAIYRFVAAVITFLVGCTLSSVTLFYGYRLRLAREPRLVTQKLLAGDTLTDLETKVSMDTSGYLKVVRAG